MYLYACITYITITPIHMKVNIYIHMYPEPSRPRWQFDRHILFRVAPRPTPEGRKLASPCCMCLHSCIYTCTYTHTQTDIRTDTYLPICLPTYIHTCIDILLLVAISALMRTWPTLTGPGFAHPARNQGS